jgi:hypothetical protein
MRTIATVLAILAALIVGAGCGSSGGGNESSTAAASGQETTASVEGSPGSSGSTGKTSAPSKKKFIEEGDAICSNVVTEYQRGRGSLETQMKKKGQKPTTAEANLKAAVPPLYKAAESFESLTPPAGDEKEVEAIIAALQKAAKGLEEKPGSQLTGPGSPSAEFQKLTKEYGFLVCRNL